MTKKQAIQLFQERKVRTAWDDQEEKWYFSIVDVCAVLTDSPNPRNYWKVLKHRLLKEGNQTVTNCNQLKLRAEDGRMRLTDVADTEQLFRIIQSIPSPKAEPYGLTNASKVLRYEKNLPTNGNVQEYRKAWNMLLSLILSLASGAASLPNNTSNSRDSRRRIFVIT